MKTGFRARLAASQLALLLVLMVLLVLTSVVVARPTIEDGMRSSIESKGSLVGYAIALDLVLQADLDKGAGHLKVSVDDMRGLLAGCGTDPAMLAVVVFGSDKTPILAYSRKGTEWEEDRHPATPPLHGTAAQQTEIDRGLGFIRCVTPVVAQRGPPVGWIEMRASTASLQRVEDAQVRMMLLVGGVALAATAILSVILGNRVTRSVAALSQAAARIGAGERRVRVAETGGGDEFAALARTFNATMDGLDATTDALTKANASLSSANSEQTRANIALEAVNKELEAFSYSVSHDLRSPLRSIDGFSQALLEDYEPKLDADGKDFLRRIRAGAQRMGSLIDDLLDLSRLSQTEMRRAPVDLSAVATKIVEQLRATDPARQVTVEIAEGLTAMGDRALIAAALENLLGNAWKYTGKSAQPRIELGKTVVEGEPAYFVRDNGAGFDMQHAGKLFGAFQRLHAASEFEGNGVGLATVQRIMRRHGGRVWAEAAPGKGATFYFTLMDTGAREK